MTSLNKLDYLIRHPVLLDQGFIYHAWTEGAYLAEPACYVPHQYFKAQQKNHIDYCLDHFTTNILVHPDDPDEIYGFACYSFDPSNILMLHWINIKKHSKNQGIAGDFLERIYPNWRNKLIINTQYHLNFLSLRKRFELAYLPLELNATKT